ncbi:OLC1v1037126C1 [Oldenlandia corymbosa var. corymbosa]|uniref:OLC1v1037125C1 n=1 Tax=Oldenlandia corymbosa var. corymbosa TaxID=529605 RepID=A0AAV1CZ20_OLDCO|nr:OLC1v1037125C1 [Oldenlandia corymbosa var. corymbosa]CAI9100185.1 OLC1v1037126C1 [Oldenlandia corymbosa var. corymbosa]
MASSSVNFSDEQVAVLEAFYAHCQSPSASQRQQIKLGNGMLFNGVDDAQIHAWFRIRRNCDMMTREVLIANKNMLMEENVRLKQDVAELMHENDVLRRNRSKIHARRN